MSLLVAQNFLLRLGRQFAPIRFRMRLSKQRQLSGSRSVQRYDTWPRYNFHRLGNFMPRRSAAYLVAASSRAACCFFPAKTHSAIRENEWCASRLKPGAFATRMFFA